MRVNHDLNCVKNGIGEGFCQIAVKQDAVNETGEERLKELYRRLDEMAIKLQMDPDNLILQRNDCYPLEDFGAEALYEDDMNQRIIISYLLLLKAEDLPPSLRIQDIQDPHLVSFQFLNEVIDWIQAFLGTKALARREQELHAVQLFLMLTTNAIQYEKAKTFILAHEMSHLALQHSRKREASFKKFSSLAPFVGPITGLAASALCELVSCSSRLSWGAGALAGLMAYKLTPSFLFSSITRAQEKEADLTAKKIVGIEGAIYYFEMCRAQHLLNKSRARSPSQKLVYALFIDQNGNSWEDCPTHPSFSNREKYLKA